MLYFLLLHHTAWAQELAESLVRLSKVYKEKARALSSFTYGQNIVTTTTQYHTSVTINGSSLFLARLFLESLLCKDLKLQQELVDGNVDEMSAMMESKMNRKTTFFLWL